MCGQRHESRGNRLVPVSLWVGAIRPQLVLLQRWIVRSGFHISHYGICVRYRCFDRSQSLSWGPATALGTKWGLILSYIGIFSTLLTGLVIGGNIGAFLIVSYAAYVLSKNSRYEILPVDT